MVYLVWYYRYDSDLEDYTVDLKDVFESRELAEATVLSWDTIETYTWVKGDYTRTYTVPRYLKSGARAVSTEFWMIEEREVVKHED